MSSFGNAIDRWNIRSTNSHLDLKRQLISDDCSSRLSPVKAMAAIVDSAYSSFSGNSYVIDEQSPFEHGYGHGNEEQVSYMDSEYVKAVYNPSAIDQCHLQHNIYCENGTVVISNTNLQVPSVEHLQHFDQSDINSGSEDRFSHKTKRSPTSNNNLPSPNHKVSRQYGQSHSPTWSRDSVHEELEQFCTAPFNVEQEDSSSFLPLTVDTTTVHEVSNIFSETNPLSQMNKLSKDHFKQINLQTRKQDSLKREEQNTKNHFKSFTDSYLNEGVTSKSTQHSVNELVLGRLCEYESESGFWKPAKEAHCYEGTNCEDVESLTFDKQYKGHDLSHNQNMKDTEFDSPEQWDIKYKCLHTRISPTFYSRPCEDFCEHSSKAGDCDDHHEVHKSLHLRRDASIKHIPMLSHQHEQKLPQSSNLCELSDKITKASTPMLYHLAGGRNNSLAMLNNTKPTKEPVSTSNQSKTFQKISHFPLPQTDEPIKPLLKTKSHSQLAEKCVNNCDSETPESLTSSAEESFMYDYREKLKVAQKKVLRETSFKRKDLQMSLPVRLKLNPSKRPSMDHIRSYSLSSQNEETKFVQPKTLAEKSCKKEESEKTTVSRIGGRKRLSKEQRKLCYSEPEKLDHLGVQNTGFVWNHNDSDHNRSDDHYRVKSFDKERTVSTSNLSKTELKQIQHNALVEYMERKANQRPNVIHQSQMQSPSRTQSLADWKFMTNETQCNNIPQTYNHRRSTGASSSYDATVTWNDQPFKTSLLEDSALSMNKIVKDKYKRDVDQCTLETNKYYSEDSSISVCKRRSKSVNHSQTPPFEPLTASTSAFSSNYSINNNRFLAPVNITKSERECTARDRGKSMEEIGTSDKVRISVLSQSTDQLCYIPHPALFSPSSTAEVHQDNLKSRAENELGKEPRQTSKEDFLGPPRLDAVKSVQERHSRSQTASASSSNTDNSGFSHLSQLHSRAAEQPHSLQTDNELFSDAVSMEDTRMNFMQQDSNKKSLPDAVEALQSHNTLPAHRPIDQPVMSVHTPSLDTIEKTLLGKDNEVRSETSVLTESSLVGERPVLQAGHQDFGALSEDLMPLESHSIIKCSHEELEHAIVSQTKGTSGHVNHSGIDDDFAQNMVTFMDRPADPATEDLTRLSPPASAEERHLELVKEIISKDKSLVDVLKPLPVRESAISLMKSLFPVDISTTENFRNRGLNKDKVNSKVMSKLHLKTIVLLEKRYSQNPNVECLDDSTSKKIELMSNINLQLEELCIQRETLHSEITENTTHGAKLEVLVKDVCKPNEYERYMMFIGDLEKVVSLLFCLSMRLARVENALSKIDENTDADEMQSLKERHSLLSRQREDAKDLKDNLDRREQVVTGILAKYLSEAQLEDYKHFVRLKTSFLIEQKDLEEKIKFHEEQLESLYNSIPP